jgi:hypothetical protein
LVLLVTAVVTGAMLIVLGVLVYDEFVASAASGPAPGPPDLGMTARSALKQAEQAARAWQSDAELAGALLHQEATCSGPCEGEWAFQFYSPTSSRLALLVTAGGEATIVRDALSPYALPTFSSDAWRVDSDRALEVWWEEGGSYLVERRPNSVISLRLGRSQERPDRLVWTVTGSIPEEGSEFSVRVDARDGTVLIPADAE